MNSLSIYLPHIMSKEDVDTKKIAREKLVKIMVFGTFDGLHPGHINFFQQAKNLSKSSFLIVSIARDKNIIKIKGKKSTLSENERFNLVKQNKFIDKVVLGGKVKYLPHIIKEKPDIIALGYDQKDYVENLKKDLKKNCISIKIIRLKPYKQKIFKNSLLKSKK